MTTTRLRNRDARRSTRATTRLTTTSVCPTRSWSSTRRRWRRCGRRPRWRTARRTATSGSGSSTSRWTPTAAGGARVASAVPLDSTRPSSNSGDRATAARLLPAAREELRRGDRSCSSARCSINDQDVQAWVWLAQGYQNSGNRAKALESYRQGRWRSTRSSRRGEGHEEPRSGAPRWEGAP